MSRRDPDIIKRISFRRVLVVTIISALLVILILTAFMMESGLTISFGNLTDIHKDHPSLFLIDLLPVFVFALLHPMHLLMNRAIRNYEERVKESRLLVKRNTEFAQKLSEGDNPESYDEMMDTDLGKALRMIQLNINRTAEKRGNRRGLQKARILFQRYCVNTWTWMSFPTRSCNL